MKGRVFSIRFHGFRRHQCVQSFSFLSSALMVKIGFGEERVHHLGNISQMLSPEVLSHCWSQGFVIVLSSFGHAVSVYLLHNAHGLYVASAYKASLLIWLC